ncbi:MATE family efflux transporter [Fictibacillus phosphorivorans]|uniref:MATE family efflux transporter n=1 Tax=Fictibacillus phosphorivorans TaxID=1221500 RepID=UPI0020413494|nr:MATE family efflux transporter [Fictibacillus phosphorivorans]MCM3719071.1 MATE family efflux transporter [Fictibacillus phosphorivorans]MCM3776693.1 MATE family efflux transporter [Fictibacillus phosphorivorans]
MNGSKAAKLSLFAITWPIFIEILLHMLMGNADTLMLSQYSDHSVAAVGLTNQLLSIIIVMFGFVATGASVVIAQAIGAKLEKTAAEVAVVSIMTNLLIGLLLSGMLLIWGDIFLRWINTPSELIKEAKSYLLIVGGFSFVQSVIMTIGAAIRSYGYTKDAMYVTIGMNILNVIGNYLFIFGAFGFPVLGVEGVAISTVFSRFLGLVVIWYLLFKRTSIPLPFASSIKLIPLHIKSVLKIGLPSAGEHLSYSGSQMVITFFITWLGTSALTTKVYTFNIMMFIFLFAVAIGQGTQILIGHMIGARSYDSAYKMCLKSQIYAMIISFLMAGVASLFAKPLLSIFTDNPEILREGTLLLYLTLLLEPGRSFNLVIISSLRAAGDVKFPVVIGVISMWGVSVTLAYLLGIIFDMGLAGIWIAFIADEWLRGLFMLARWRKRKWQNQIMVRGAEATA